MTTLKHAWHRRSPYNFSKKKEHTKHIIKNNFLNFVLGNYMLHPQMSLQVSPVVALIIRNHSNNFRVIMCVPDLLSTNEKCPSCYFLIQLYWPLYCIDGTITPLFKEPRANRKMCSENGRNASSVNFVVVPTSHVIFFALEIIQVSIFHHL